MRLDQLLGRWNETYFQLQASISTEVALSHADGLAQGDDDRAKDNLSWAQTTALLLQTEIGIREKQIQGIEHAAKPTDARLLDKDYLADREKRVAELQAMLGRLRDQATKAQSDTLKAKAELSRADDAVNAAQQRFGDSAVASRQAMQADKSAEDAFQVEFKSQQGRTCAATAGAPTPTNPGPEPAAPLAPAGATAPTPTESAPVSAEITSPVATGAVEGPSDAKPSATALPERRPPAEAPSNGLLTTTSGAPEAPPADLTHASQACSSSKLESDVLATINSARTDPPAFAKVLAPEFGGGSYADAKKFLKGRPPTGPLACDGRLELAAHNHLADQGPKGGQSHAGSDGSQPWQRMKSAGVTAQFYAEEISVTFPTANGVVSQLILDPVPPNGKQGKDAPPLVHPTRNDLMNPDLKLAGVACGQNKTFKVMCVINLSSQPEDPSAPQSPP